MVCPKLSAYNFNLMRVCFLLSYIPNPRMYKRIDLFRRIAEVSVVCIHRTNQDIYTLRNEDVIDYRILDLSLPPSSQILRRYKAFKRIEMFSLNHLLNISPDIIYLQGLDMLSIAYNYSKRNNVKIIYEVADLRESFIKSKTKNIFRRLIDYIICYKEKNLFNCVSQLIVTSAKFYQEHYASFFPKEKTFEFPNVPNLKVFSSYVKKERNNNFVVGFIGAIRYLPQMKLLVDVAQELDISVFFAGAGDRDQSLEFERYCAGKKNISILGKYNYDEDISRLYQMADCIYSVYDADNPNVRIALPNKLYESIFCELPIIVAKNTYLSELVEKYKVGLSVSHNSYYELRNAIILLKDNMNLYNEIVDSCRKNKSDIDLEFYNNKMLDLTNSLFVKI